jgi:hypothetical protein
MSDVMLHECMAERDQTNSGEMWLAIDWSRSLSFVDDMHQCPLHNLVWLSLPLVLASHKPATAPKMVPTTPIPPITAPQVISLLWPAPPVLEAEAEGAAEPLAAGPLAAAEPDPLADVEAADTDEVPEAIEEVVEAIAASVAESTAVVWAT